MLVKHKLYYSGNCPGVSDMVDNQMDKIGQLFSITTPNNGFGSSTCESPQHLRRSGKERGYAQ